MHAFLGRRFIAKPLLAAVLVGVSTWAGASPAGVPPHHETVQVAFADLPIPVSSTTTTTAATTTTTVAPPPTTPAPATPDSMDDIAATGVKTLYLQAAKDDTRSPGDLVNPEILGPMLVRSHARGVRVVAWYLPKFYDLNSDMRRLEAMRDFRSEG